ncbi:MAG: hypothetical protein DYG98_18365 [Haliscomenobacteraceae bacterium CHB4]|nr:hypothetical protein [Haliscomenobacteraceae bacterium CHB4]
MAKLAKNISFGGVFFVDALASSVGIILLILFVLLSMGLDKHSPRKLSKLLEENIIEGNMPIETGYLVKGGVGRNITDRCFCYTPNPLRCPLIKVYNNHIELVWDGIVIRKDEFYEKKKIIFDYVKKYPVYPEEYHGIYFLIYENGMYHFLNDFNNEEIDGYWNKEWIVDDLKNIVAMNTGAATSDKKGLSGSSQAGETTADDNATGTASNGGDTGQDGDVKKNISSSLPGRSITSPSEKSPSTKDSGPRNNASGSPSSDPKQSDSFTSDSKNITSKSEKTDGNHTSGPPHTGKEHAGSKISDKTTSGDASTAAQKNNKADNSDKSNVFDKNKDLTKRQKQLMNDPKLDEVLTKFEKEIQKQRAEAQADISEDRNNESMSMEDMKREMVKSGIADSLLKASENGDSEAIVKQFAKHFVDQAIQESASTVEKQKRFSRQEFKQKVEPLLKKRRELHNQSSSDIIFVDDNTATTEFDQITQIYIPANESFSTSPNYIFHIDQPIDIVAVNNLDGIHFMDLTQDTNFRIIMSFHTDKLPYSPSVRVISRAYTRLALDSVNLEKYNIPNLTYSWIPVKYKTPMGRSVFKDDKEFFVYGMIIGDLLYLPAEENEIIFTNFEQESPPSKPPNFMWTRILIAIFFLVFFLGLLILTRRKLI